LESFEELISTQNPGIRVLLIRAALRFASWPYSLITWARNLAYELGIFRCSAAPIPIISVGNLTVGGTGKTPSVDWLCTRLEALGQKVAILSRGYGARAGELNDEGRWLQLRHPKALVLQSPDRRTIAKDAAAAGATIAILDDGFQHRKLRRNLDWVLVDATRPFGYDAHLPRGLLREHPSGLRRADAVFISRAESLSEAARAALEERLRAFGAKRIWAMRLEAEGLRQLQETRASLGPDWLIGRRITAACGLGNPRSFLTSLEGLGAEVLAFRFFPDHHEYDERDIEALQQMARDAKAEAILITEKDAVKIARLCQRSESEASAPPIYALTLTARCEQESEVLAAIQDRIVTIGSRASEA
jgi:tetraacyldisaccharide 4'-kinase